MFFVSVSGANAMAVALGGSSFAARFITDE